ncbi:type II toxin-antitoxin system RelE family toxin [Pseudescherichia vulneris]
MQMKLTIQWSKSAKKDWLKIDARFQKQIETKLEYLGDISAPPLDIRKLTSPADHYRLRVGDYRIIFTRRGEDFEVCYIVAVRRRTSKTYAFHEEQMPYEYTVYKR